MILVDLQLKPYRTEEFVHRLFYETSRFTAFNNSWVVKARVNNSQKDPTQSSERDMTYQVGCTTELGYAEDFTLCRLLLQLYKLFSLCIVMI